MYRELSISSDVPASKLIKAVKSGKLQLTSTELKGSGSVIHLHPASYEKALCCQDGVSSSCGIPVDTGMVTFTQWHRNHSNDDGTVLTPRWVQGRGYKIVDTRWASTCQSLIGWSNSVSSKESSSVYPVGNPVGLEVASRLRTKDLNQSLCILPSIDQAFWL